MLLSDRSCTTSYRRSIEHLIDRRSRHRPPGGCDELDQHSRPRRGRRRHRLPPPFRSSAQSPSSAQSQPSAPRSAGPETSAPPGAGPQVAGESARRIVDGMDAQCRADARRVAVWRCTRVRAGSRGGRVETHGRVVAISAGDGACSASPDSSRQGSRRPRAPPDRGRPLPGSRFRCDDGSRTFRSRRLRDRDRPAGAVPVADRGRRGPERRPSEHDRPHRRPEWVDIRGRRARGTADHGPSCAVAPRAAQPGPTQEPRVRPCHPYM